MSLKDAPMNDDYDDNDGNDGNDDNDGEDKVLG